VVLFHFEIWDAVTQQSPDFFVAFIDRDSVAGAGQLLSCGESGRARANNSNCLAG
jgi:hypothetical protein